METDQTQTNKYISLMKIKNKTLVLCTPDIVRIHIHLWFICMLFSYIQELFLLYPKYKQNIYYSSTKKYKTLDL